MSRANFLRRAGNVKRFHTHSIIAENTVAHHSWGVAVLAFELCDKPSADLIKACLFHDAFEVETGDIPWTAKKRNPELKLVSAEMEADVALEMDIMWNLAPSDEHVLKFCDMLDLLWFCVSERKLGSENMDEVFSNGARFLHAHLSEFSDHPELAEITHKANDMFHEVKDAYYAK